MSEPSIGVLNHILNNEFPGFTNNIENDDGKSRDQIQKSVVNNFRQEAWYCLFIGIPLLINLVIIYYVIKWLFFKYKFDYVILPNEDTSGEHYDGKEKTFSKQNINDGVAISNDIKTVSQPRSTSFFDKGRHLAWPYSPSTNPNYPEYEKMSKVISKKDKSSKNIDFVKRNKKLRRFSILSSSQSNENIISLRKLSAKYDSVLLQLSAMSCHRGFKRLLKTMKGTYNVAKQHEKQFLDKLFENKVKNKLSIYDSELIGSNDLVDGNYRYEYTKVSPTI